MAKSESLTVVFRVTDSIWGRRAAAAALMLYEHACPDRVEIHRYSAEAPEWLRIATGYEVLGGVQTDWLLSIDADSLVYGHVRELVHRALGRGATAALRASPLQVQARNGWRQDLYEGLFNDAGLAYRPLGTTCAFLLRGELANAMLPRVGYWREWIDARGQRPSRAYHHAQAAFALALAVAGVRDQDTDWWGQEQISFEGEPHGVIHHEAHNNYVFPYRRTDQ